jgi:hypothetical protein
MLIPNGSHLVSQLSVEAAMRHSYPQPHLHQDAESCPKCQGY